MCAQLSKMQIQERGGSFSLAQLTNEGRNIFIGALLRDGHSQLRTLAS
jgi:hypothetical protein